VCLGVLAQLDGDWDRAADYYHAALAIRRDNPFVADLLSRAMQQCWYVKSVVTIVVNVSFVCIHWLLRIYAHIHSDASALSLAQAPPVTLLSDDDDDEEGVDVSQHDSSMAMSDASGMNVTGASSAMNLTDTSMNITQWINVSWILQTF